MRLESILQRAKEAAKCEASSSSSSAHDEVPWPELKRRAIIKGLDFLLSMGETLFRNETLSSKHGADVLLPFYVPTSKAAASPEERHALKVALRLAAEWRSRAAKVVKLPPSIPPSELLDMMQGLYSLECLGLSEPVLREQLFEKSANYGAVDFLKYDPKLGEPAANLREACMCGAKPAAGAAECPKCKRPTVPMSKFDVWLEALVWSFHGCRMRIGLGACFFDVLRQVCHAFGRLYPQREALCEKDKHYLTYALTHVIYALNNFDERSLPPSLFPAEVPSYLREQMKHAIRADDPDLAGELLDCLVLGEGALTLRGGRVLPREATERAGHGGRKARRTLLALPRLARRGRRPDGPHIRRARAGLPACGRRVATLVR